MHKKEKLEKIEEKMKKADLPLKKGANRLVFGVGDANAEVMFIGEGPGYWEDQKGVPFVGNAGKFLDQMITVAGLNREDVYITNVVHYRPPENRDPKPEELAAFKPYLDKMVEIIEPKIIVTLGRFSMGKFIPNVLISQVHGKPRALEFLGMKMLMFPMYHPAAGLRNGKIKMRTEEDFKKLKDVLEKTKETDETLEQLGLV